MLPGHLQVHGGFERGTSAQVVVGEGREPITGALPLFINPQHWSMAKLQAKPLLGWMCTLNPLVSCSAAPCSLLEGRVVRWHGMRLVLEWTA